MNNMQLNYEIDNINSISADSLDRHDYETWIDLFTEDGFYTVQSRENYDNDLPLALIRLESQDMMRDRIYGCMDTIFHVPYYTKHLLAKSLIISYNNSCIETRTNYSVFRTKPTKQTEVFNVGCYHDVWLETDNGIKLKKRNCVYDSEMVLNALIYPI